MTLGALGQPRASAPAPAASISVVVTTYHRSERLRACLVGLRAQDRPPDQVVVVIHVSDEPARRLVDELAPNWSVLTAAPVARPGLVAALNRGLAAAGGELVAFVDDDAIPGSDWLSRIERTFARDERTAAVGGRDLIEMEGQELTAPPGGRRTRPPEVGRIQWYGRMLGNHHLGAGPAREVDVLKGVNMSFRRASVAALGFDERLRGNGAQVHSEMSICLPLRKRGLRVLYDPEILVRHYPAPRQPGDERENLEPETVRAYTHNEALAILDHFGALRRLVFTAWGVGVGTTASPGLAVLARDLLARRPAAWTTFRAAQRGRIDAWRTHLRVSRPSPSQPRIQPARPPRTGRESSPGGHIRGWRS